MTRLEGLLIERSVFIGTEPSLDKDMPVLAKALREKYGSYNVLLTNGVKLADMDYIDEIIFSIKAVTDSLYKSYTDKTNKNVLENFKKVYNLGKKLQAECLLIPEYIDAEEIEKVAEFIAGVDKDITLRIDGYFPVANCPWRAATNEEIAAAARRAKKHLSKVNYLISGMKPIGEKPVRIF